MAEKSPRSPRSIAEKLGEPGGSPIPYCGACGLPNKDCACSSYKPRGETGVTRPGTPVVEPKPGKFGG